MTRSADAIAEALDDRGVALRVATNRHVPTLSCTCLSEDFSDVLAVVADVARNPVFPQDEIDKRRAETINAIRQDMDNPGIRASEALQAPLCGLRIRMDGRPGNDRDRGAVPARGSQAYHAARFAPSTLFVVIVGDVRAAEATARVGEAFAGWSAMPLPEREVPPVPPHTAREQVVIEMPDKSQSDIAYGFTSISRLDPTYCNHWVMNNILGQFGLGGRLAENIRERQGMAYTRSARSIRASGRGRWSFGPVWTPRTWSARSPRLTRRSASWAERRDRARTARDAANTSSDRFRGCSRPTRASRPSCRRWSSSGSAPATTAGCPACCRP
jgi:zinc protease